MTEKYPPQHVSAKFDIVVLRGWLRITVHLANISSRSAPRGATHHLPPYSHVTTCIATFPPQACPDSAGDEIVVLPDAYSSYNYKIRVSTWEGVMRPASACSPKFEIRGRDRPAYSTPSPTGVPEAGVPSLYPIPPGNFLFLQLPYIPAQRHCSQLGCGFGPTRATRATSASTPRTAHPSVLVLSVQSY